MLQNASVDRHVTAQIAARRHGTTTNMTLLSLFKEPQPKSHGAGASKPQSLSIDSSRGTSTLWARQFGNARAIWQLGK